jgi:hypothetical protein
MLTRIFCILVLMVFVSIATGQTWVHYMPSNHTNGQPTTNVTRLPNFAPLCSNGGGLPGLDMVRGFAGVSTCPGSGDVVQFDSAVDHILLIDDTRPLSRNLIQMLDERRLLQTYNGRQVILPQVVNYMRDGEDSGLDILVVGEMAFRQLGSTEVAWFGRLSDSAGNSICDLPDNYSQTINNFARQVIQMNNTIKSRMINSLGNFETGMSFESSYSARPQVGAALLSTALSEARSYVVSKIADRVPGFDVVVSLVDSAIEETERAEEASNSYAMSHWIQQARTIIDECVGNSLCGTGTGDTVAEVTEVSLTQDIEMAVCRLAENRRAGGIQTIERALANSLVSGLPGIKVFEKAIYESWIDSHFDREAESRNNSSESAVGTIEIVWVIDEEGGMLTFNGDSYVARTIVPEESYGNSANDGMNVIISQLSAVNGPLDFKLRKKVCFIVDNVNPGGRSKVCWLLDKDNSVLRSGGGSLDMARRAYEANTWRQRTTRFRRP